MGEPGVNRSVQMPVFNRIIAEISRERQRQDEQWGEQNHDDLTWYAIFGEEAGEIGQACIPFGTGGYADEVELEKEIIQAAAVLVSWLESRARRG